MRRETSADHIGPRAVLAYPGDSAAALRKQLRHLQQTTWELVCVIEPDERLLGTLTAAELLALPDEAELGAAARRDGVRVLPDTDQEKMASIALHHGVSAMPVVELHLAAAVALALAGASVVASVLGLLLPWLLARFGSDAAYGSGPLATIVQDVLSLLIYFGCVSVIVLWEVESLYSQPRCTSAFSISTPMYTTDDSARQAASSPTDSGAVLKIGFSQGT